MTIDLKQFRTTIEQLQPGETMRLNHEDCPAGEDTRRRLYLTRPHSDTSVVLGYCHNCSQGVKKKMGDQYERFRDQKQVGSHYTRPIADRTEPPLTLISDLDIFPTYARGWIYKQKLNKDLVTKYNICHDTSSDRVYLPMPTSVLVKSGIATDLQGYQLRKVNGYGRDPKYIRALFDQDCRGYTRLIQDRAARCAVIVEDYISGIHVAEAINNSPTHPGVDVFINYGTKVSAQMCYAAAKDYPNGVVWLDNDSDRVKHQARTMRDTINLYQPVGGWVTERKHIDPKAYKPDEILEVLEESLWTA